MRFQIFATLTVGTMVLSQSLISPEDFTGASLLTIANSTSFSPLDHAVKSRDIEDDDDDDEPTLSARSLEKRDAKPWIGSHFLPGCATTGDVPPKKMHGLPASINKYMTGDRPLLANEKCQVFAPQTRYIGVSWGAGAFEARALKVYQNSDCSGPLVTAIIRKGAEAGACFTRHDAPGLSAVMATRDAYNIH